jgi:hypothetical protein
MIAPSSDPPAGRGNHKLPSGQSRLKKARRSRIESMSCGGPPLQSRFAAAPSLRLLQFHDGVNLAGDSAAQQGRSWGEVPVSNMSAKRCSQAPFWEQARLQEMNPSLSVRFEGSYSESRFEHGLSSGINNIDRQTLHSKSSSKYAPALLISVLQGTAAPVYLMKVDVRPDGSTTNGQRPSFLSAPTAESHRYEKQPNFGN